MTSKHISSRVTHQPIFHLQDQRLPLAYPQRLPGGWSGAGWAGNTRSISSPFVDKGWLKAFLQSQVWQIQIGKWNGLASSLWLWRAWAIVSRKQVILPTSPSARYCTLFEVKGCLMHKQRVALKIGNGWGASVTAVLLLYSTLHFLNLPCMYAEDKITCCSMTTCTSCTKFTVSSQHFLCPRFQCPS